MQADERMERELQKAALVSVRSTKRQLKEKRIRAFDDDHSASGTVKPFNLAALKVGDFACNIILAPFILAN